MSNDLKKTSRKGETPPAQGGDMLPPHSEEMEKALIGCLLQDALAVVPKIAEKFGDEQGVFYVVQNQELWNVALYLHSKGNPVDMVTVFEELRVRGINLDQSGGVKYLNECHDAALSPGNFEYYLSIVWERYVARRVIQQNVQAARQLMEFGGQITEAFVAREEERSTEFRRLLERGEVTPKHLAKVSDFDAQYFDLWFNPKVRDEFGYEMPFPFPLRFRPGETTLMTGDNGSGKSSMLSQLLIHIAGQFQADEKIVVASLETAPEITLWMMSRQLLGTNKLPNTDEGQARARDALAWLHKRFLLYNFLGITEWQELLNTFKYAQAHLNGKVFSIDSVMRIGIQDDDYATQGIAAARFANFAVTTGSHLFEIVHENKGSGRNAKDNIRGSKQWSDNANNVCGMLRNAQKAMKLSELEDGLNQKAVSQENHDKEVAKLKGLWDSKFLLHKQRWPGSQQNGSKWLYFDGPSLQLKTAAKNKPKEYL